MVDHPGTELKTFRVRRVGGMESVTETWIIRAK
jgi:hypothetical protein